MLCCNFAFMAQLLLFAEQTRFVRVQQKVITTQMIFNDTFEEIKCRENFALKVRKSILILWCIFSIQGNYE